LAQQTQEINFFAADTPSRADAKITELSRLVGGVPALHDAVKALRSFLVVITLEPFGLDQTPAQGRGGLLILASKVVLADRPPEMSECREWLALGVQRLAPLTRKQRGPQIVSISCTSSTSAIAGKLTTSQGSCAST